MAKILAFAGSTRRDSWNKKLVQVALAGAEAVGAETTFLDLRDLPLPLYDEDDEREHGLPENALTLKALFKEHNGFLISSPEYNSSISGVLKNVIDWASRPAPEEAPLECFRGKTATLMSASTGALGGIRGLVAVRSLLGNIGVLVLPTQLALPKAHEAFTEDGQLRDALKQAEVYKLGADLHEICRRLRG